VKCFDIVSAVLVFLCATDRLVCTRLSRMSANPSRHLHHLSLDIPPAGLSSNPIASTKRRHRSPGRVSQRGLSSFIDDGHQALQDPVAVYKPLLDRIRVVLDRTDSVCLIDARNTRC
jgi:hypothetical protein